MNLRVCFSGVVVALVAGCNPSLLGAPCHPSQGNCPTGQICLPSASDPLVGTCVASDASMATGGGSGDGGETGGGAGGGGGGSVVDPDGGTDGGVTDGGSAGVDGGLSATPASHDFGTVPLTTTSAPFLFTISNSSADPTGTLSVAITGAQASQFTVASNSCTGALGGGGSCQVGVTVQPSAGGAASASLDVSGVPGGSLSMPLTALAIAAATLEVSPSPFNFADVVTAGSAAQTFTVINTGGTASGPLSLTAMGVNASEFAVSGSTCTGTLAPGARCTFVVTLSPSSAGPKSASVTISATPGGSAVATLTGKGLIPPAFTITPSPGLFAPTVTALDSAGVTFTVTNTGEVASSALSVTLSGAAAAEYVKDTDTCSGTALGAMTACSVILHFRPSSTGQRLATLTVGNGAATAVTSLVGTGLNPSQFLLSPSGSVSFGSVGTNGTLTLPFNVLNVGQGTSGVPNVVVTGAGFSLPMGSTCTAPLNGGDSCAFSIVFAPNAVTAFNGSVTVSATAGGTQTATLLGQGVTPGTLTITPSTGLSFGDVLQGQTAPTQAFNVRNTGATPTGVPVVSFQGTGLGFSQTNTCTAPLGTNQTCVITVTFAATNAFRGPQTSLVEVTAAPGGTVSGSVTGNAQAPAALSLAATTPFPSTTVNVTNPTHVTLTITNDGDQASGVITPSIMGTEFAIVPQATDCRNKPLGGQASCQLELAFTPSASGPRSSVLTLNAAPGGNPTSALSGTGLSAATLTLVPVTSANFGDVPQGLTSVRSFRLSNTGQTGSGPISFVVNGGGFSNSTGPGGCVPGTTTLAAMSQCTISVTFGPSGLRGNLTGTVSASATPAAGTPSVALAVNSQAPPELSPNNPLIDFGNLEVNTSSAPYTHTITNIGDVTTGTLSVQAAPTGFAIVSDTCTGATLAQNGSCVIVVTFSPTTPGVFPASTIKITDGMNSCGLDVSGTGMWRLTVTATTATGAGVDSLDGKIVGCSAGNSANCTALYANGLTATLRARTSNGSGTYFQNWDAPANCLNSYGAGPFCNVTFDASKTATPVFAAIAPHALVFTTSSFVPANATISGFDTICNVHASDAGINSTNNNLYVAWASTSTAAANTRLPSGSSGGIKRLDGKPMALSRADLLAGAIRYPAHLDELGRLITTDDSLWTGTLPNGTSISAVPNNFNCNDWTNNTSTGAGFPLILNRGIANGGPRNWTDGIGGHACSNTTTHLLCIGRGATNAMGLVGAPAGSKRIFRSAPTARPSGIAGAHAVCQAAATAASLGGTWKAMLADTTASAFSNAAMSDARLYVRIDGSVIGTGANIGTPVIGYTPPVRTGRWQLPDFTFASGNGPPDLEPVWTGSTGVKTVGTNALTCQNWSSSLATSTAGIGRSIAASNFWLSYASPNCTTSWGLYCVEQ